MPEASYANVVNEQVTLLAEELDSSELVLTPPDDPSSRSDKRSLTRMELIKIILSLQEIQNIQMDRLQELVEQTDGSKGTKTEPQGRPDAFADNDDLGSSSVFSSPSSQKQTLKSQSKRHWTVGRPLETLVESDEAEATTPRNHKRSDTTPSTMATSTPWSRDDETFLVSSMTRAHGLDPKDGIPAFVQTESNEEIAMDDQLSMVSNKDGHFLAVQHHSTEHKSDADASLTAYSITDADNLHQDVLDDDNESEDESETIDVDDSALCPTVIASERKKKQRQQQIHHFYNRPSQLPLPSTPLDRSRRLSHISFAADASPAPTLLTMDMSGFEQGGGGWNSHNHPHHHSLLLDDDNLSMVSQETPVLERYRVASDDRSPTGLAVVPNQRGLHRRTTTSPWQQQQKMVAFQTPQRLPPLPQARRVFRKTPYRSVPPATPTIDENKPFELQGQDLLEQYDLEEESLLLSPASSPEANKSPSPEQDDGASVMEQVDMASVMEQVEAMRLYQPEPQANWSSPVENENVSPKNVPDMINRNSLPSCVSYAKACIEMDKAAETLESTPPPVARRHSTMAELASLRLSSPMSVSPLRSKDRRFSTLSQSYNNSRRIQPISHDDYNSAPRIIQMQVSMADVEAATKLLNDALDVGIITRQFSETRAKMVLKPLGFSQRKCKTVMMSLCHWQRLIIRRLSQVGGMSEHDEPLGMYFEVV